MAVVASGSFGTSPPLALLMYTDRYGFCSPIGLAKLLVFREKLAVVFTHAGKALVHPSVFSEDAQGFLAADVKRAGDIFDRKAHLVGKEHGFATLALLGVRHRTHLFVRRWAFRHQQSPATGSNW